MDYKICIADSFEHDLDLVTGYIAEVLQNPAAADKLLELAEKTVNQIGFTPYMFSLSEDETLAEKDYRNVAVGNYELFYRIDEAAKTVFILRFLYGARDLPAILE